MKTALTFFALTSALLTIYAFICSLKIIPLAEDNDLYVESFLTFPSNSVDGSERVGEKRQEKQQPYVQGAELLPIVDILSVGSLKQMDLQTTQNETIGSHRAVRYFYGATEEDDTERDCNRKLTLAKVEKVSKFCRKSYTTTRQHTVLPKIAHYFFDEETLVSKRNPVGWLCAQKRPLDAFVNMIQKYGYKQGREEPHNDNLPDYLIILDDDTWINLDAALPFLSNAYPAHEAHVIAGCLMITPRESFNFTVPYGGYGIVFTRRALQNWLRPIYCNSAAAVQHPWREQHDFEKMACWRLKQNGIGESSFFHDGMSILELMHAYAVEPKFYLVDQWRSQRSSGFCMHSDWAWAYFVNYYHISQISRDPHFTGPSLLQDRLAGYNNSRYHLGGTSDLRFDDETMQQCVNGIDARGYRREGPFGDAYCGINAHICHRITPTHMRFLHQWNRITTPHNYRYDREAKLVDHVHSPSECKKILLDASERGLEKRQEKQQEEIKEAPSPHQQQEILPILDILSVGNVNQVDLAATQTETIGSHRAVRNFYHATEYDETEKDCKDLLTLSKVKRVSKFCRKSYTAKRMHSVLNKITDFFADEDVILTMGDPVGWLCAHKRPLDSFVNMIHKYKYQYQREREEPHNDTLPDYLIVMDDDTWINLNAMLPFLSNSYPAHEAHVVAGCLRIPPSNTFKFTVPYGGYGIVFTRQALQNWLRPIHCNSNSADDMQDPWAESHDFEKLACWRLTQNGIGESAFFHDGMSILELMQAYVVQPKFHLVDHWRSQRSAGFCMDSDWAWAYFVNYYNIGQIPQHPHFTEPSVFHDRFAGYNNVDTIQKCVNAIDPSGHRHENTTGDASCDKNAHICHGITPNHMRLLHHSQRIMAPQNYRYRDLAHIHSPSECEKINPDGSKQALEKPHEEQQPDEQEALSPHQQQEINPDLDIWSGGSLNQIYVQEALSLRRKQEILPILDILSIGSLNQIDVQMSQNATIGSHRAVRHFYRATEDDETEKDCNEKLTLEKVKKVSKFCSKSYTATRLYSVLPKVSAFFIDENEVASMRDPVGWLCAQKRPLDAFMNMMQKHGYKQEQGEHHNDSLPDYLIVLDADTWINLDAILPFLSNAYPAREAHVVAGCLMIAPPNKFKFTVPYGGYGIVFTRQALQNWLRPIHCNSTADVQDPWAESHDFEKLACWRLRQNGIGESSFFHDGMSILELMHAYAVKAEYHLVNHWRSERSAGFCMDSDWAWAYFVNYYHIGQIPQHPHFTEPSLFHDRLTGYNNSRYQVGGPEDAKFDVDTIQQCVNGLNAIGHRREGTSGDAYCDVSAHICHRITPAYMRLLHHVNRITRPHNYR